MKKKKKKYKQKGVLEQKHAFKSKNAKQNILALTISSFKTFD